MVLVVAPQLAAAVLVFVCHLAALFGASSPLLSSRRHEIDTVIVVVEVVAAVMKVPYLKPQLQHITLLTTVTTSVPYLIR